MARPRYSKSLWIRGLLAVLVWGFLWGFFYHLALMLEWSWGLVKERGIFGAIHELWFVDGPVNGGPDKGGYMKGLSWFRDNVLDGVYFAVLGTLPCAVLGPRLRGLLGLLLGVIALGALVKLVVIRSLAYLLEPVHIAACGVMVGGFLNALIKPTSWKARLVAAVAIGYVGGMAITRYTHHHLGLVGDSIPPLEPFHGVPYIFAALAFCPPVRLWNNDAELSSRGDVAPDTI